MASNEGYSIDKNGRKSDAALFDNEEGEAAVAKLAVRDAIARGLSPEQAEQMYGYRPPAAKRLPDPKPK